MKKDIIGLLALVSLMGINPIDMMGEVLQAMKFQNDKEDKLKDLYAEFQKDTGNKEISFNEFCVVTFLRLKEKVKAELAKEKSDEFPASMPPEIRNIIQKLKANSESDEPKHPREVITAILGKPDAMGYVTKTGKVKMTDGDGTPIKGEAKKAILKSMDGKMPGKTLTITVKKKKVKKAKPEAEPTTAPEPEKA